MLMEKLDNITLKLGEALAKIEQTTDTCKEKQDMLSDTLQTVLDEMRAQNTGIRDLEHKMDECTMGLGDFMTSMFDAKE